MASLVMIALWVRAFILNKTGSRLKAFGKIISLFKLYDFLDYYFFAKYLLLYLEKLKII